MRNCWHSLFVGIVAALVAGLVGIGCAGPNAQVSRCQAEKQELLAVIEQEKSRSQVLQERALALESRLDQSEKQLAQVVRPGSRFGPDDEPRTATSPAIRPQDRAANSFGTPVGEPKDLGGSSTTDPAANSRSGLREMKLQAPQIGASRESRLAALAERDTRLELDRATGLAHLKIDIPFEPNRAELTAQGRQRLDEVAAWLKSSQTSDLRVLVSGHSTGMQKPPAGAELPRFENDRQLGTARAQAVADYLDRRGIKEDRLAVMGSGSRGHSHLTGSVEILLAEPETSIAGLRPAGPVRR